MYILDKYVVYVRVCDFDRASDSQPAYIKSVAGATGRERPQPSYIKSVASATAENNDRNQGELERPCPMLISRAESEALSTCDVWCV